ncbi:hypothetical protein [Ornithinimicrobium sp. INDO-MA30-4]|uniref:hypothetical protein n=1 Tax=Ornithinimicrobium sp. INDO-MA30-4 TaxID=2908651 RepID=UPI0037C64771
MAEQFSRLAKIDLAELLGADVVCEAVPGDDAGLGWRTRVEFAVSPEGTVGLRQHRSPRSSRSTPAGSPTLPSRQIRCGQTPLRHANSALGLRRST